MASDVAETAPTLRGRPLVVLVFLTVLLDQLSKRWAVSTLAGGRDIEVFWTLRWSLGYNSGFAFGSGRGFGVPVGILAVVVIGYLVHLMRTTDDRATAWGLALVVGGAAGNVLDRLFRDGGWMRGKVVDFVDLGWWPVFNVADSAISVGAVLLLVGTVVQWRRHARIGAPVSDAAQ